MITLAADSFAAPTNDPRFCALPDDVRKLVCERLDALRTICAAPNVTSAIREIAERRPGERGWGEGTIRKTLYRFMGEQHWTSCVDKARAGARWWGNLRREGIPEAFAEFLGQMYCANQRNKFRGYYLHTLLPQYRRWIKGDESAALPGYLQCPPPNANGVPEGWTYGNLQRIAKRVASDYSRKMIQIGPKAASQLGAPILTTREGIDVGQVYIFDDSKNDFKVLYRGRACDLWSLHVLDLASGCNIMRGYKPSINDAGVRENIREREMIFLLAALGSTIGFCPRGVVLVVEKGTATIRPRDEEILHYLWPNFFDVQRGPMGGGPGISALFTGPEGGNPRWKAPLESWHNIIRNASASMLDFPGQSGSLARVNDPEGLERLMAADEALCQAMRILPQSAAQKLQFGLMSHVDAVKALDALTEVINTRRDHALEGWRRCGHYLSAFRMAPHLPPMPDSILPTLPAALLAQVRVKLASDPNLICEIALHPREVFEAGKSKLRKFTAGQVAMLLGEVQGDERPVRNQLLSVNVPEVDPDEPLHYGLTLRDLNGGETALRNGDTYLVRVNPYSPQVAFLYDAKGGFLGVCDHWGRVNRLDSAGLQRQFARDKKAGAQWTAEARRMAAPITQRAEDIARNNKSVISAEARKEQELTDLAEAALMGLERR